MFRIVALLLPVVAWAQTSADAVKQLAGKIVAQAPSHATVALSFENRSSLGAAEASDLLTSLEQQLRTGGMEVGESEIKLRVAVSEDPARYLLIAQIASEVTVASWNKPPPSAAEYRIAIKRTAVWEQRDPILDVKLSNSSATLLVLEPVRLVGYNNKDGRWQMDHSTATNMAPSRDPRGRVSPDAAESWIAGRNYMDGGERGYFYSKAETGAGTLLAGIDGQTRLYGLRPEPLLVIHNWGSDLVAIESACGSQKQVLAAAPTTDDLQDHLQAFEISPGSYSPVSEPLPLPGPVTALWPSEAPDQVTLVVHNSQTGMYEASRISLACAQ